jgi:macrodomain Ter protein organizer (MatP/YcbG family)
MMWRAMKRIKRLRRHQGHLGHEWLASDARSASITHITRTTIDIDAAVLRRLKERRRREGKTLGQLVSELLANALREKETPAPRELEWTSRPMGARVDLEDKEAVRQALEGR